MAKKAKVTKKTTAKKRSSSYSSHHHEQNTFILIAGGGLLVLLLVVLTMSGIGTKQVQQAADNVTEQVQDVQAQEEETVSIKNSTYSPETLTVKVGTTVTFTNNDSILHTATADDDSFDTGLLAKGESSSITFSKAGTVTYHCTQHPQMSGTIVVEE